MTEQRFGRYRLLALLGRGGMGEVWRAVDTEKDREVALKVLGSWLNGDPDFATRFRRESALAARLRSPHIVPIHDYGEIDGRLFIDMPLIEGADLATLLQSGPLPPTQAVRIVEQVARALDVAHRAGLVHRDVKPSNALVCTAEDDHAYLIDFGIAKALDGTRLSMSGAVVGTAAYMAPECFRGGGDARSDVYSLGCVLYEALTGQPPYSAPHAFAYGHLHQHEPVPRPSVVRAGVPATLDDVVVRAMAKSPDDRFATATGFATAARAALLSAPAAATIADPPAGPASTRGAGGTAPTRPTTSRPGPPATRRGHRRVLITALVSAVALVVVVVVAVSTARTGAPERSALVNSRSCGGRARAMAISRFYDRTVAVTGSDEDVVGVCDLSTDAPLSLSPPGYAGRGGVTAVTISQLDNRPVAVTGNDDGTIGIWDVTKGQQRGQPLLLDEGGGGAPAVAVTRLDDRPVVIGANVNDVRLWDLETARQLPSPFAGNPPDERPLGTVLATTELDGRPVAAGLSIGGRLTVWDLDSGRKVGDTGSTAGGLSALAIAQLDGRPVAVSTRTDGTVQTWDLATGRQLGRALAYDVSALATTQLDGRSVIVTGGYASSLSRSSYSVRIWDLAEGKALGRPLITDLDDTEHDLADAMATTEFNGRPVAVSSANGTIRVWDLRTAAGL